MTTSTYGSAAPWGSSTKHDDETGVLRFKELTLLTYE
jgi:hypothetical protein